MVISLRWRDGADQSIGGVTTTKRDSYTCSNYLRERDSES